jgi:hypothetical protein
MAGSVTFKQGEDKKISVNVIKEGVPVDVSVCTNIKAILKVNNVEQKKYALVAETDHGSLEVPTLPTNQIDISVERDESKNFPVGAITIIVLAAFPDVTFTSGERVEEYKFAVGRVAPGEGINENI